jgi:hypothetical protein
MITRRDFVKISMGTLAASATLLRAVPTATRPFCRFSLHDGWSDTGPEEYITRKAGPKDKSGVPQVVARIRQVLSVTPSFEILIAEDEDNAFATVAGGKKILVVDVGFLEKLDGIAKTQWAAIQVIAHEVGHHIAGFGPTPHKSELNADYWSGQALQRLGAALKASTAAILAVGTDFDTPSHPKKTTRAEIIERGWTDSRDGRIDYSFCLECEPN